MISQRSVGRLQRLLHTLMFRGAHVAPLLTWEEYRTQLYEDNIERGVLERIEEHYGRNPRNFLPAIHDGSVSACVNRDEGYDQPVPDPADVERGQALLKVFSEVALGRGQQIPAHVPDAVEATAQLRASLELDGYEFVKGRLVPKRIV